MITLKNLSKCLLNDLIIIPSGLNPGEIPSPWKEHPRENIDGNHPLNYKNFHGPNGK